MCCVLLRSAVFCRALLCCAVPCCTVFCSVLRSALRCGLFCSVFCSCSVVVLFLFYSCSVLVLFCVLCSVFSFLFDSALFDSILLCCVVSLMRPALTKTLIISLWYGGAQRRTCSSFFSYGNRLSQEPVHRHFAWFLQSGTWNDFELLRPGPLFGFGHFDIVGLHDYKWWNTWTADYWLLCNYIHLINQRKLGSNTSELRTNRSLRLEMMKGGRSHNNTYCNNT